MAKTSAKVKDRRRKVRERRARTFSSWRSQLLAVATSRPVLTGILFVFAASAIAMLGEERMPYSIGQRLSQPIYAEVEFTLRDPKQTSEAREAAKAKSPDYFKLTDPALSVDRIATDLFRLYQMGVDADSFEAFAEAMKAQGWEAQEKVYASLHSMSGDVGRARFENYVDKVKTANESVVRDRSAERREPPSTAKFVRLVTHDGDGKESINDIPIVDISSQASEKQLAASAARMTKIFPYDLRPIAEAIVLKTLREQPTIIYDKERTLAEMLREADRVEDVYVKYDKGQPLINPHLPGEEVLTASHYELLKRHREEYLLFLRSSDPAAATLQNQHLLERIGLIVVVAMFSAALFAYIGLHHSRVFKIWTRTVALTTLLISTLLAARLLQLKWPQISELVLLVCLTTGSIMAIAYPRRFAMGVMAIAAILVTATLRADILLFLTMITGLAVTIYQLEEIRTRTKIIGTGLLTAFAVAIASAAGALLERQPVDYVLWHGAAASCFAMLASFLVSGVLPFIERVFGIATSLTLREWTDSRNPLLQLLAREAPGTYSHSLTLGTLAESACEQIGANGLLAQVGAMYHDIGKVHKSHYFTENQEGNINRHDNLSPTMSLLIILSHVKDGIEMAKEYKLPRLLHQFIEEHHGTTVVRYFHHAASEKQEHVSIGKHDREVPEAEFRYAGPKPRSKESAVLMICDSVEGAVRSLSEPTPGRIESVVHQIIMDRLNDGQFDDCDITLRELSIVEDSLVKSLCSLYHGRIAYPKARGKSEEADGEAPEKLASTGRVKSAAG